MEFNDRKAIYLQIADKIYEKILNGQWTEETRIPSTRDLAVELAVNPNTIMHTYGFLQENNIIYNKRGIGYFIAQGAKQEAMKIKKDEFIHAELPHLFQIMQMLNISMDDLYNLYREYQKQGKVNEKK